MEPAPEPGAWPGTPPGSTHGPHTPGRAGRPESYLCSATKPLLCESVCERTGAQVSRLVFTLILTDANKLLSTLFNVVENQGAPAEGSRRR